MPTNEMRRVAIDCVKSALGPTQSTFSNSWIERFADLVLESEARALDWVYEQIPADTNDEDLISLRKSVTTNRLALRRAQKSLGTIERSLPFAGQRTKLFAGQRTNATE